MSYSPKNASGLIPLRDDATTTNKHDDAWFDRTGKVFRITSPSPEEVERGGLEPPEAGENMLCPAVAPNGERSPSGGGYVCMLPSKLGYRWVCLTRRFPAIPGRPRNMITIPFRLAVEETADLNNADDYALEALWSYLWQTVKHERQIKRTVARFLTPEGKSTYKGARR
jgi:hypothetical protein